MKNFELYSRWIKQAIADLDAASYNKKNFPFNSCFLAQQSGEKALKAYLYKNGKRDILTHSTIRLVKLCSEISQDFDSLKKHAKTLDTYYLPSRYPDSLPDETPMDFFDESDSETAINAAVNILEKVKSS